MHLGVLNEEGVYWVTRSKESLCLSVVKRLPKECPCGTPVHLLGTDKRILGLDGAVAHVLMRFLCVISSWNHSFTRLFTLLRAALWRKIDLWDLLKFCGTAVDIFGISRPRRMPIFQDTPSKPMGQHRDQTEKILLLAPINS